MKTIICPSCNKPHEVDAKTLDMFGPDAECLPCINAAHIKFMRTTGKRLNLTCVPNCPCGAPPMTAK